MKRRDVLAGLGGAFNAGGYLLLVPHGSAATSTPRVTP